MSYDGGFAYIRDFAGNVIRVATLSEEEARGGGLPTGWTQSGDPATVDTNGGGVSGAGLVRAVKATFGFADFTDQGGGLARSPVAYTLAVDEQLLMVVGRVTESFDDSTISEGFYVASAAVGPFGYQVGITGLGPNANVALDGLVGLFTHDGPGSNWATSGLVEPVEVDSAPLDLYVFNIAMAFDGAQGEIEVTFYVVTPVAA